MTNEEIKQRADEYASAQEMQSPRGQDVKLDKLMVIADFIAGAHSRDNEVEMLQNEIDELSEQLKMNAENIQKLRNPWISVEERLPDKLENDCESDYVLTRVDGPRQVWYIVNKYDYDIKAWKGCSCNTTHWMPIPELKKGE